MQCLELVKVNAWNETYRNVMNTCTHECTNNVDNQLDATITAY